MKTIDINITNHPFLKGMKPDYLAILARHARAAEFTSDQMIFRQNENAHEFYLILAGSVAVESYVARADNLTLQIVNAGDVLGWSWLFPPFVWHFQARALEPTKAIFLNGAGLLVACEQNHSFGYEVMQRIARVVIQRLEAAQKRLLAIQKTAGRLPVVDEPMRNQVAGHLVAQSLKQMLVEHPFFKGMKAEHLKILSASAMKEKFEAGHVIFREGDPANRFYLIQHGKVVLEARGKETTEAPFEIIGNGDVLGWSWLFPPFKSHFKARALEPTESIFLYGTRLRETCEQNHELGYALMKRTVAVVIQRLQATRGRLLEISAFQDIGALDGELLAPNIKKIIGLPEPKKISEARGSRMGTNKKRSHPSKVPLSHGHRIENNSGQVKHLLIPVDVPISRSGTVKLLNCARTFVERRSGKITLLQVVDPLEWVTDCGYGPVVHHEPNKSLMSNAHRRLKTIQKRLNAQGHSAACVVLSGTAEKQIPIAAKTLKADAILVLNVEQQMLQIKRLTPHKSKSRENRRQRE